ncbi:MAG: hypothetical protein HN945_06510 [Deltaproteobacteria bacterium]|jgi:hypothetical protein|nr:hypothetical protein [Deltaproteobacteria bacterium]
MPNHKEIPFSGTVTARNCPTCGHHEIGLVSENGVFRPLRTGTRVVIMDEMEPAQIPSQGSVVPETCENREDPSQTLEGTYWVPEPLKGDRRLRLKYGVVIRKEFGSVPVTEHIYESAYMQKLSYLLENEVNIPIAVILDRFFVAPHLASGESRDMANNMWEELEEIRQPVEEVTQWLKEPDEKTLQLLLQPSAVENLEKQPVSEETALEEQRTLELEDFLELL